MMKPIYERDGITLYHGDCAVVAPQLGTFDLLLTDPPYGLGDHLRGGGGIRSAWRKHFASGPPEWDRRPEPQLLEQLLGRARWAIVWGGQYFPGLPVGRCWLCWNKIARNWSSGEFELAWTNLDKPNRAYDYSRAELAVEGKYWHPTQKPLPLVQWCLGLVPDAATVLDPWAGSGTTLLAAKLAGLRAVGIEQNETYCRAAVQRLAQRVLPLAGRAGDGQRVIAWNENAGATDPRAAGHSRTRVRQEERHDGTGPDAGVV